MNKLTICLMALLCLSTAVQAQNKVGVNTTSPGSMLSVNGNVAIGATYSGQAAPTNGLIIEGNIGIGTVSPSEKLEVMGNIKAASLAGTGTRMVVADANGVMSTQAIPSGGGGSTLNSAYNFGGAGAGRTITADNGAVLVEGTDGFQVTGTLESGATLALSGAGTRMFFYPKKAAFRAGNISGMQWNNDSIGNNSVAMGYNTVAKEDFSIAIGNSTRATAINATAIGNSSIASGDFSTAIGFLATASKNGAIAMGVFTISDGDYSTAMGYATTAYGDFSTTMGSQTAAHGILSTAMGNGTTANGENSTAMGYATTAHGDFSTAMGYQTTANGNLSTTMGYQTTANGTYSTAMGKGSQAIGIYSTAMGNGTIAQGERSTATGSVTTASGYASFTAGEGCIASGMYSTAMGRGTIANAYHETVMGAFNTNAVSPTPNLWIATDRLFTIGNGGINTPSNALVMLKNGNTTFTATVTASAFVTASDKRFKNNLTSLANVSGSALTNLASIGSYYYNYKVEEFPERQFSKDRQIGFIAQEIEAIYPELVITDEQGYKKVDYAKITPVLVEAIKELKAENEALKAESKASKQDLNLLKAQVEKLNDATFGNAQK